MTDDLLILFKEHSDIIEASHLVVALHFYPSLDLNHPYFVAFVVHSLLACGIDAPAKYFEGMGKA